MSSRCQARHWDERQSSEQDTFQFPHPRGIEPKTEPAKINTYYLGWDLDASKSPGILILF